MSPVSALAKKIRLARKEIGLTQSELAYRMGISAQLVSAFEGGRIHPSPAHLAKIAQFTHKPLYFFTGQKLAEAIDRLDRMENEIKDLKELLSRIDAGNGT